MRRRSARALWVTVGVCLVVILGALGYVLFDRLPGTQSDEVRTVLPDFSLPDGEGKQVVLTELAGELKLVNFWASWSPYSREELIVLSEIQKEYSGRLSVVALCRDTNPNDGKVFLRDQDIEHVITFVFDKDDAYFRLINGFAVPETVLLNEDNEVLLHIHGPFNHDTIRSQIEEFL